MRRPTFPRDRICQYSECLKPFHDSSQANHQKCCSPECKHGLRLQRQRASDQAQVEKRRHKVCPECEDPYYDSTRRNSRKVCPKPECTAKRHRDQQEGYRKAYGYASRKLRLIDKADRTLHEATCPKCRKTHKVGNNWGTWVFCEEHKGWREYSDYTTPTAGVAGR